MPDSYAELPPDYLLCRDLRHYWQAYTAEVDKRSRTIERVLICPRCGTQRIDMMDRYGFILRTRYRYPTDYKVTGGAMTSGDRASIRLLNMPNVTDIGRRKRA
jgi:hypothetical protein